MFLRNTRSRILCNLLLIHSSDSKIHMSGGQHNRTEINDFFCYFTQLLRRKGQGIFAEVGASKCQRCQIKVNLIWRELSTPYHLGI